MSYITPSSYIYVLEGVPFDETYQHSIYFANTTAQYNYFSSKIKYSFSAQSYQRVKRGYCRVQQKADRMYGCNYMMFQNTNYGSKWFYAFILDVEYINDNVSEIHYEIDVLQSWMFRPASGSTEPDSEFQFNKCFVEREHTVTDNLWEHTVPEGLEIGDYVLEEVVDEEDVFASGGQPGQNGICIMTASGWEHPLNPDPGQIEKLSGDYVDGVYCGSAVQYLGTDKYYINRYLSHLTQAGQDESIVAIFMCPNVFFTMSNDGLVETHNITKPSQYVGTYEVKNKKLLNSPYQHLLIDVGTDAAIYEWEYFSTAFAYATIAIKGTVLENAKYMVYPQWYKRVEHNYNEGIIATAGAQCGYSIDSYKAWYAQNQYVLSAQEKIMSRNLTNSVAQALVAGTAQALVGTEYQPGTPGSSATMYTTVAGQSGTVNAGTISSPGTPGGIAVNPVNVGSAMINAGRDIANAGVQYYNAKDMLSATKSAAMVKPNCPRGSSVNSLYMSIGINKPRFYNQHIRQEYAEIIDGYFDRYGYAVHTFKVPTLNNRPNWTFVKTVDCTIRGNIPNDDSTKICKIMNTGITFWTNGNNVGNYTLNNRPI